MSERAPAEQSPIYSAVRRAPCASTSLRAPCTNPKELHFLSHNDLGALSLSQQTSEVIRLEKAPVMAALSVRRSSGSRHSLWISAFLLLIFIQMLFSLVFFAGGFIHSNETLISPSNFCLIFQHGELSCGRFRSFVFNILITAVTLGLYVPLALVAFALLAMLLAAYAKDRAALWLSMACQAASSLLILTGLIAFLILNWSYVSWKHMTFWFYDCVGVQVQLVFTTALTCVSGRRLTSDWK